MMMKKLRKIRTPKNGVNLGKLKMWKLSGGEVASSMSRAGTRSGGSSSRTSGACSDVVVVEVVMMVVVVVVE